MDNPVSWLLLCVLLVGFMCWLFNKGLNDYEARRHEAEEYWENFHR